MDFLKSGIDPTATEVVAAVVEFADTGSPADGCIELTVRLDPPDLQRLANAAEDLANLTDGVVTNIDPAQPPMGDSLLLVHRHPTPLGKRTDPEERGKRLR